MVRHKRHGARVAATLEPSTGAFAATHANITIII